MSNTAIQTEEQFNYEVRDLGLAAYIMMQPGMELLSAKKQGRSYSILFSNPNPENRKAGVDVLERLRTHYANSEFADFDGKIRTLKKVIYGD